MRNPCTVFPTPRVVCARALAYRRTLGRCVFEFASEPCNDGVCLSPLSPPLSLFPLPSSLGPLPTPVLSATGGNTGLPHLSLQCPGLQICGPSDRFSKQSVNRREFTSQETWRGELSSTAFQRRSHIHGRPRWPGMVPLRVAFAAAVSGGKPPPRRTLQYDHA